jgi:ribosomal protein S12 methylthiotransferase accessory factor
MDAQITFPRGKRVEARLGAHVIRTDQSAEHGGAGTAPEPFDLFLASIGTCAGAYVLGFCDARGIQTSDIIITQRNFVDEVDKALVRVALEIALPPTFPEKYRIPLLRAVEGCKVKRTLASPPAITIVTTPALPKTESPVPVPKDSTPRRRSERDDGDACDEPV